MDAQVNPALGICHHSLSEAGVGAGNQRAQIAVLVLGDRVELVGDYREVDVVGAVEVLEDREQGTADGVAGGV